MELKIAILIIFVSVTNIFASYSYSQNARITLDMENKTLEQVMDEIEIQSEFYFIFNQKQIDVNRVLNIQADNKLILEILPDLFTGTDVNYAVLDRKILLTSEPVEDGIISTQSVSELQQHNVTGKVTDASTGDPMPGVNIAVRGTSIGTMTNMEGKYTLNGINRDAILAFSFIGYIIQEIQLGGRSTVDVALMGDLTSLEEVVVVGYGVQKKVNVLGSISTVKAEELTVNPMPFVAQGLMGKVSGMYIKNVNGQPGDESGLNYNIRGFGDPLIIIDGATASKSEFINLNPHEIEDFSILKDAAAASVYGARAGNGVILVTTKRGLISPPKITYSSNLEMQYFLKVPEWVNSEQYARMVNTGKYNEGADPVYTEEQIKKYADGSDPDRYPNTDWWGKTMRKFAPQLQQNLSVQGGTEKVKYFISGGYFYQEAMMKANDTKNKRYNLRSNIDVSLTDKLKLNLDLSATKIDYIGPMIEMERTQRDKWSISTFLFRSSPTDNFSWPDPTKITHGVHNDGNPYQLSLIENVGYKKRKQMFGDAKIGFSYDLPFNIHAKANFRLYEKNASLKEVNRLKPDYTYNWDTDEYSIAGYTPPGYSMVYEQKSNETKLDQQYSLNWGKKFGDNNLNALIVYEILSDKSDWLEASRMNYAYEIDYLFAGPTLNQDNSGKGSEGGRIGLISRINYDYKGKYLMELNGRYDASPKFPKETRWGFFPSASIGWRISEEGFISDNLPFINNLKLRASYGKLGFDNTGNFQFLETFSLRRNWIYDGSTDVLENGIMMDALPNPSITWEKMTTSNAGLDFTIWNSRLEGSFDVFYRLRTDVLGTRIQSMPNVVGASLPQVNYAEYDNRGWEFVLNYRNKVSDIEYSFGGNISWNREKTVYVDQNVFASDEAFRRGNKNGEWTDRFWGYMDDGLFHSQEEIDNWADIDGKNNATVQLGQIKYIDYNGDGKITADDQVLIGRGEYPRLMYGLNMSAEWKGFSFSMLWQGAGLYDFNSRNASDITKPFKADDCPTTTMLYEFYTPEGNPWLPANTNAKYPLYKSNEAMTNTTNSYSLNSQLWLVSGNYIRLKSIDLSYTLPNVLTKKWGIDICKLYISGYNILTISEIDYMDPEADTNTERSFGDYYPPVGTYNLGLLIQF